MNKFRKLLAILFISFTALYSLASKANDTGRNSKEKIFYNSIVFGVGAGTLVGLAAITNFKRNFSKNIDWGNVSRGASYGLYVGIILGIYLISQEETMPPSELIEEKENKLSNSDNFKTHNEFKFLKYIPELTLIEQETHWNGMLLSWGVVSF